MNQNYAASPPFGSWVSVRPATVSVASSPGDLDSKPTPNSSQARGTEHQQPVAERIDSAKCRMSSGTLTRVTYIARGTAEPDQPPALPNAHTGSSAVLSSHKPRLNKGSSDHPNQPAAT